MQKQRSPSFLIGLVGCSVLLCVGVLLVGTAAWWVWNRVFTPSFPLAGEPAAPETSDSPVSDFTATDLSGHTWRLADLRGRPVVINFWASWCPPCREELPELQRLADKYADAGLVVLLINVDEPDEVAANYLRQEGITLPCIVDEGGRLARRFRVLGLPTTLLVSPDGTLAGRIQGWQGSEYLERGIRRIVPPSD